ncbi:MAG TPA: 2,3,4,5-tetrahydropyridine-2,6-dicarboxylate N-succinyltransferase [Verrucomicrobiae bacterium]|nr:2,3,4,5-tetrahydropyridine-2,6-dicarboxylate N-succinyltransferase [Verrucomicrobiae bacterium]
MLQSQIEGLFESPPTTYREEHFELFRAFKTALNRGDVRAAEPDPSAPTAWRANVWVKKGILLGFRMGAIVDMSIDAKRQPFVDKSTYPVRAISIADGVRIVPGGSSVRDGAYLGRGVVCMPPMFVNVGAYVGEGTMIDSHALVGSCAQIGNDCHLSAAAQIGGVLEPVGALPVIVEDNVMIGGNSGVYEGTVVKRGAVLGTGTILNGSVPVYDLVRDAVYVAKPDCPLVIPENAVVVPGSRAVTHAAGAKWGLSLQCAVIVKYRDQKTGSRVQLEDLLR